MPDAPPREQDVPAIFDQIASKFDVATETLTIEGYSFSILAVRDTNVLVDAIDPASFAVDERLPYWAELWSSSIELARYCLHASALRGLRVLELGCGLGLAGIAAARSGATVTMTDFESDALLFAQWNAYSNLEPDSVRRHVRFRHLDWRAPGGAGEFDAVIGSDILYERKHIDPVLDILDKHLAAGGRCIFTDPARSTGEGFKTRAIERGYEVRTEARSLERGGRSQSIVVFFVQRKGGAQ